MKNIISTYFYNDTEDLGAQYGNLFVSFEDRNLIYWKTVFCLFSSCYITNKNNDFEFYLFTNVKNFPYKEELELMGVKIISDLALSNRNIHKWATVKYFFDVLCFVSTSSDFRQEDNFIFLDTDIICTADVKSIFDKIQISKKPLVYEILLKKNISNFHGISLELAEMKYFQNFKRKIKLKNFVGGEFFGASKFVISEYINEFKLLAADKELTTEELILTMCHSNYNFDTTTIDIYRIWTTIREFDVPRQWFKYKFLHFPSEKARGFLLHFDYLFSRNINNISINEYKNSIHLHFLNKYRVITYLRILKRYFDKILFFK